MHLGRHVTALRRDVRREKLIFGRLVESLPNQPDCSGNNGPRNEREPSDASDFRGNDLSTEAVIRDAFEVALS
jgi:hypothetical protein